MTGFSYRKGVPPVETRAGMCVRCGVAKSRHVESEQCRHYVEPAPRWLRFLTGA